MLVPLASDTRSPSLEQFRGGWGPSPLQPRVGFRARTSLCSQVVEKGGPYPLIILPQFGGYWIEDPENVGTPTSLGSSVYEEEEEDSLSPNTFGYKLECRGEARAYRRHFLGKVSTGTLPEWTRLWGGWHGSLFQDSSDFSASSLPCFCTAHCPPPSY